MTGLEPPGLSTRPMRNSSSPGSPISISTAIIKIAQNIYSTQKPSEKDWLHFLHSPSKLTGLKIYAHINAGVVEKI